GSGRGRLFAREDYVRGGVADRGSGAEGQHARPRLRAWHLGTKGSRLERLAARRLAQPDGAVAVRIDALADAHYGGAGGSPRRGPSAWRSAKDTPDAACPGGR